MPRFTGAGIKDTDAAGQSGGKPRNLFFDDCLEMHQAAEQPGGEVSLKRGVPHGLGRASTMMVDPARHIDSMSVGGMDARTMPK